MGVIRPVVSVVKLRILSPVRLPCVLMASICTKAMPSKTDSMVAVTCNDFFSTCINLVSVRTGNNKNGMLSVCCATLFLISFILGSSTCALMVDIYFFLKQINVPATSLLHVVQTIPGPGIKWLQGLLHCCSKPAALPGFEW